MVALHLGQTVRGLDGNRSWERRLPLRELECFRFGTAISHLPRLRWRGASLSVERLIT